jgi:hypothetical protein
MNENKHGCGNASDETAIPYIKKCRLFVENDDGTLVTYKRVFMKKITM